MTPSPCSGEGDGTPTSADPGDACVEAWLYACRTLDDAAALIGERARALRRGGHVEDAAGLDAVACVTRGQAVGIAAGTRVERNTERPSGEGDDVPPPVEEPAAVQPGDVWEDTVDHEQVRVVGLDPLPAEAGVVLTTVERPGRTGVQMLGNGSRKITTPRWRLVSREQPEVPAAPRGRSAVIDDVSRRIRAETRAFVENQIALLPVGEAPSVAAIASKLHLTEAAVQGVLDEIAKERNRKRIEREIAGYPTDRPLPRVEIARKLGMTEDDLCVALAEISLERGAQNTVDA